MDSCDFGHYASHPNPSLPLLLSLPRFHSLILISLTTRLIYSVIFSHLSPFINIPTLLWQSFLCVFNSCVSLPLSISFFSIFTNQINLSLPGATHLPLSISPPCSGSSACCSVFMLFINSLSVPVSSALFPLFTVINAPCYLAYAFF